MRGGDEAGGDGRAAEDVVEESFLALKVILDDLIALEVTKKKVIRRRYSFSILLMSRTSFLIEFTNFAFEILTSSK